MKATAKLSDAVNELGNALTAAGWPAEAMKKDDIVMIYDTKESYKKVALATSELSYLELDFHDCVNELCLKCGSYHEEHNGACDDCRWLKPRRGW